MRVKATLLSAKSAREKGNDHIKKEQTRFGLLLKRIRGFLKTDMLVERPVSKKRKDACSKCPLSKKANISGLYLCNHPNNRCGCSGGTELRLLLKSSNCPEGKW